MFSSRFYFHNPHLHPELMEQGIYQWMFECYCFCSSEPCLSCPLPPLPRPGFVCPRPPLLDFPLLACCEVAGVFRRSPRPRAECEGGRDLAWPPLLPRSLPPLPPGGCCRGIGLGSNSSIALCSKTSLRFSASFTSSAGSPSLPSRVALLPSMIRECFARVSATFNLW